MIRIANQTTQTHRIYLPKHGFIDVPPHEERRVTGDVHAAFELYRRYNAVLVNNRDAPPPEARLVFFDDTPVTVDEPESSGDQVTKTVTKPRRQRTSL